MQRPGFLDSVVGGMCATDLQKTSIGVPGGLNGALSGARGALERVVREPLS